MKICIPTKDDRGLESSAFGHFGSAPFFTMVEVERGRLEVVANPEPHSHSESCQHVDGVKAHGVDAVVCSGVGRRAFAALREVGIDVLTPADGTVSDIVEAVRAGDTRRLSADEACGGGRRHGRGMCARRSGGH